MKEKNIYQSRVKAYQLNAGIMLIIGVVIHMLGFFGEGPVSSKIVLVACAAVFLLTLFAISRKTSKQVLIIYENYGLMVKTSYFLRGESQVFIHKNEIEDCLIYEYLSPIRVLFKLGLKLHDGKLFSDFYVA